MVLTAHSAKTLAGLILTSLHGPEGLARQEPLTAASRGPYWIVRGKPVPATRSMDGPFRFFMYIDKTTAEVRSFGDTGLKVEIPKETLQLLKTAHRGRRQKTVLGLPPEPAFDSPPDLVTVIYGGIINTPETAIDYARVLMRATPRLAKRPAHALRAEDRERVWHVTMQTAGGGEAEVLRFSRINGKVLSGDL